MKRWTACVLLLGAAACSSGVAVPQDPAAAAEEGVDRALSGNLGSATPSALEACALLESVILPSEFGVEASVLEYKPSSASDLTGHAICAATWDRPDKDELVAAYTKETMAYMTRPQADKGERPKVPRTANTVGLTILSPRHDSAAKAVASLEAAVVELSAGITVEVRGTQHTTKVEFDDWLAGVGDKAVWAPRIRELSVASQGVRYAVTVNASDDDSKNKAQAIELAKRIGAKL